MCAYMFTDGEYIGHIIECKHPHIELSCFAETVGTLGQFRSQTLITINM